MLTAAYVLIMIWYPPSSAAHAITADFITKAACESAAREIDRQHRAAGAIGAAVLLCAPKS